MKCRFFTLIELLTVIAVIALLASLLFPSISHVRGSARALQCRNNLMSIYSGAILYASHYDNSTPPNSMFPITDENGRYCYEKDYYTLVGSSTQIDNKPIAKAPLQRLIDALAQNKLSVQPIDQSKAGATTWWGVRDLSKVMFCPDHAKFKKGYPSRVAKDCYFEGDWNMASYAFTVTGGEKITKVHNTARKVYAMDSPKPAGIDPYSTKTLTCYAGRYIPGSTNPRVGLGLTPDATQGYNFFSPAWFANNYADINDCNEGRHGLTAGSLFFDGHIELMQVRKAAYDYQALAGNTDNNMFWPLKP